MSLLCLKLTYLIHSKSQKFYNSLQSLPSLWTLSSLLFCSHTGFLLLSEEHIPTGRLCSGHSVCLECSPHIYTCNSFLQLYPYWKCHLFNKADLDYAISNYHPPLFGQSQFILPSLTLFHRTYCHLTYYII